MHASMGTQFLFMSISNRCSESCRWRKLVLDFFICIIQIDLWALKMPLGIRNTLRSHFHTPLTELKHFSSHFFFHLFWTLEIFRGNCVQVIDAWVSKILFFLHQAGAIQTIKSAFIVKNCKCSAQIIRRAYSYAKQKTTFTENFISEKSLQFVLSLFCVAANVLKRISMYVFIEMPKGWKVTRFSHVTLNWA